MDECMRNRRHKRENWEKDNNMKERNNTERKIKTIK